MQQEYRPADYRRSAADMLLIVLAASLSIAYFLRCNPEQLLVFDDSYITLRFAANFFTYGGITYDGNVYLSGATSPLHIVFIALLGLLMKMETAALATGILFFILSSLLIYFWILALYKSPWYALMGGTLMSTSGWLIFDALTGLETTTFICFSLLTLYLYHCFRHKPLYLVPLALSIYTRPEGWFIAGALLMWEVIRLVREDKPKIIILLATAGLFLMLVTPYCLLFYYCTGALLPGTAFAKAVFFAEGTIPFINKAGCLENGLLLFYKTLLYPAPLLLIPIMFYARRVLSLTYLWFYGVIFYLLYFFLFPCSIKHYWCRYQHIFIPLLILALSGGTCELLQRLRKPVMRVAVAGLVIIAIAYNHRISFTNAWNAYSREIISTRDTKMAVALWLKHNTPHDALIALHDIGTVGYFSQRRILDLVGLVNPEVTRCYLDSRSKTPLPLPDRNIIDYLRDRKPDYLVMFPDWDRFFNLLQPSSMKHFQLVYTSLPLYPTVSRYNIFKCTWDK